MEAERQRINDLSRKAPTITSKYVAAVEEAQKFSKENPLTPADVLPKASSRYYPVRPPRSPDRTQIRDRKDRKNSITKKDFYYKGYFLNIYNALKAMDVSDTTIARLSETKPCTFKSRMESDAEADVGYQEAMAELELRLSHLMLVMAKGYDFEEVKIKSLKSPKTGDWVEVEKTVTMKHHPGDMHALTMYLTNRFPDNWKVSRELITGKKQTYDDNPSERNRKAIESYARDVLEQNTDKSDGEHSVQDGLARVSGNGDETGTK